MRTVAALYVEKGGPYFTMPDVDTWDVARDARTYAGPHPVVAHPPCGPWGRLRHLYRGDEHDCAPAAVVAVRTWGGVLECAWGHVARKTSWLYIVGVTHDEVIAGVRTGGTPTHWISGFRTARALHPSAIDRTAAPSLPASRSAPRSSAAEPHHCSLHG